MPVVFLTGIWFEGSSILALNPWHACFNMQFEGAISEVIWVKLSNLPLELWDMSMIKAMGNVLGMVIKVGDSIKHSVYQSVVRVLVEIDVKGCLHDIVEVMMGSKTYSWYLDHVNVPFWCARCHRRTWSHP